MPYKNKEDQRAYAKRHYLANKEAYVKRAKAHDKKKHADISQYLKECKSVPCADCGVCYPYYVMDFDHQGDKEGNLGDFRSSGWSMKRVKEEVAKCQVVCANCHRERTYSWLLAGVQLP